MIRKLTPGLLRNIVLEEKKKIEASMDKKSKKAKKEMELDETEHSPAKPHKQLKGHEQKLSGPGKIDQMKELKEHEMKLRNALKMILERKELLRKQIISDLDR